MEYIVGIALALLFCAAAAALGMDRERVFYPAVTIAVASYYLAFAVADGRPEVMLSEAAIAAVFVVGAVAGFKFSPWLAVVALAGHGVMDAWHHQLVQNTGVPRAWPGFCMSFDVTAAVFVAWVLRARQLHDGNFGFGGVADGSTAAPRGPNAAASPNRARVRRSRRFAPDRERAPASQRLDASRNQSGTNM